MRVLMLDNSGLLYTSQVYLVLGSANRLADINTLVDVGQDPAVLDSLGRAPTGVGKVPVARVVLTHSHSDHCALLPRVLEAFEPEVYAYSPNVEGVSRVLHDGAQIAMGDGVFEVIHTPGHSSDSVCLYNQSEGILFAGDSPLLISTADGTYEAGFLAALERICARDVRRIYFGHGEPLLDRCNQRLHESKRLVAESLSRGRTQAGFTNLAPRARVNQ